MIKGVLIALGVLEILHLVKFHFEINIGDYYFKITF